MKQPKLLNSRNIAILAALAIAIALPLFLRNNQYVLFLATTVLLYAVLASAWNIIGGMAGQLDLGAAAYVGLGAFTTGTLLIRFDLTPWVGMFIGALLAMGVATLIGIPLFGFKVKEVWYALSSSALVEVFRATFMMWNKVGGPTERYLPFSAEGPRSWYLMRFNTYVPYFYIMLALLVIVFIINQRIRYSKLGYSLLALGEDEDAVEVLGVDSRLCKLKALMIYSFVAGLVGGVYGCIYGYLHPSFFSTDMSLEVVILGIVGGMGVTYGPLLAAIFLVSFREYLRASLSGMFPGKGLEGLYLMVYALILIVVALFQPRGIAPLIKRGFLKLKSFVGVK